jgi:sterol desaturase/sphingolipid hydroxylase (fatty acid hydroxylase superfamily)
MVVVPLTRPLPPPDPATCVAAPPLRRRRRVAAAGTVLAVLATLVAGLDPLVVLVFVFVLVVPFEKLFPRHRQRVRRRHLGTDVAYAILSVPFQAISVVAGIVLGALCLAWVPGLLLRPLVLALPDGARVVAALVLFDLAGYWGHRLSHQVPFLWRFHRIHHSTETLDWVSGFRVHPFDGAVIIPPVVFLLAAGFSPETTGVLAVAQIATGLFLHANVRWRLRPLQRLVATPEFHHWHHERSPAAHNRNFAGLLPVWDIVFGTYRVPQDARPARYGVDPPVPDGVPAQLWHPLAGLRNPLREMRHPIRATRSLMRAMCRGARQVREAARRPSVHSTTWH